MSTMFNASEVLQFAIKIEENGEKFYRQMADKINNQATKNTGAQPGSNPGDCPSQRSLSTNDDECTAGNIPVCFCPGDGCYLEHRDCCCRNWVALALWTRGVRAGAVCLTSGTGILLTVAHVGYPLPCRDGWRGGSKKYF